MTNRKFKSREELLEYALTAVGVPFYKIDKTNRLSTGKGALGTVIEEGFFGYMPNSNSKPDFEELGVELKVTPFKKTKKGISAKERLVCNIIDYMTEYHKTFETSSFMSKCSTMLLMLYEYVNEFDKGNMSIDRAVLFSFPEEDLLIIRDDWYKIITKIREGKAHEISESDTLYLGACTKGINSSNKREQPFSDELAMQRAYSLKASYMTYILREYIYGEKQSENIIKYPGQLREISFENWIIERISPYFGRTLKSLIDEFGLTGTPKNINELIIAKILGVKGRISKTTEFQKANIVPKTIRIRRDGHIVESMSFPTFKFIDLINQEWEESDLFDYLSETKFLFIVFRETSIDSVLESVKFWNIPNRDLEEVRKVWERTKEVIVSGVEIIEIGGRKTNNFPKKYENAVAHVRPHATNAEDVYPLPDGRMMTKQCFWLNNDYIKSQL